MTCHPSCDGPKILVTGDQFEVTNVCKSLNFYIDPGSTEQMELGTQKYPYRNMRSATSEILNHYSFTDVNINIYLKENARVYVEEDTTYFFRMNTVTVTSYSDTSENPGRALIVQTSIVQPTMSSKASFHLLKHTDIDITNSMLSGGYEGTTLLNLNQLRRIFRIIETNFTMYNVNAYSEVVDYNRDTFFMQAFMLQNRDITISKPSCNPV